MAAYVLVHVEVTDPVKYEDYRKMVLPSITQYGGRFLVRGPVPDVLEGTWDPKRIVILEFPSAEQARAWWSSPEYTPAKLKRQAASNGTLVLLAGV